MNSMIVEIEFAFSLSPEIRTSPLKIQRHGASRPSSTHSTPALEPSINYKSHHLLIVLWDWKVLDSVQIVRDAFPHFRISAFPLLWR